MPCQQSYKLKIVRKGGIHNGALIVTIIAKLVEPFLQCLFSPLLHLLTTFSIPGRLRAKVMSKCILYQQFYSCVVYTETGSHGQSHNSIWVIRVNAWRLHALEVQLGFMCLLQKHFKLLMLSILDGIEETQSDWKLTVGIFIVGRRLA